MPMYDYRCERCTTQFDVRQSFSDDTLAVCPAEDGPTACVAPGEGPVRKVFSGVAFSLKGDGFYKNDHGANAPGRRKEREASSSKDKESSNGKDSISSTDSSKGTDSSASKDPSTKKDPSSSGSDASRAKADAGASSSTTSR